MSDGNRGEVDNTRLKQWLTGAVLIAFIFICIGGIQHWIYYDEASSHAAGYARDAKNQIAAECGVPVPAPDCEREIDRAARQEQRSEYDLYSQQAMALWTAMMGAMAVIGVSLSGVGVYLIWGTWRQTAEAAESARNTLRSYIARERAILRPMYAPWGNGGRDNGLGFHVKFKNSGESAAQIVTTVWRYTLLKEWPSEFRNETASSILIEAKSDGLTPFLEFKPEYLESHWLIGWIIYSTLEKERFKTYFCFKVRYNGPNDFGEPEWGALEDRLQPMPHDT